MPERVRPLLILAYRLLARRVPSLSSLIAQISNAEEYAFFVDMVKTYLPERQQDILREPTPTSQMARFASYFEDRYFPLEPTFKDGMAEGYEEITRCIPVICMGISYEDYHEAPEWRPGALLMAYLVDNPYSEEDLDVPLAEACREHLPDALIERAGQSRLFPGEAHSLLKGTRYESLALWADRLHFCTGNFFLDTEYEMLWNSIPPDWTPENVEELTKQWMQAEAHDNKTGEFMDWLEDDLTGRFEELVSFIEERRGDGTETPG